MKKLAFQDLTPALVALCAWALMAAMPAAQRPATAVPSDGVARLLQQVEQAVLAGNADQVLALIVADSDRRQAAAFARAIVEPRGATRIVIRERDRTAMANVPPDQAVRVVADVFTEFGRRARISTWRLDLRRPPPSPERSDDWRIASPEILASFLNLHRLALGSQQYVAKDFVLRAEDLELRLPSGSVFMADVDEGTTALVLLGRGQAVFRPTPAVERQQMRVTRGSDTLDTRFSAAFVRVTPSRLREHIAGGTLEKRAVPDVREAARAAEVFSADAGKSFGLDLGDLAGPGWSLLPAPEDFLAELHTKRDGVLTYARAARDAEDIMLFSRADRRNLAIYTSQQKLTTRGPFYADDDLEDYEILHYDIEASFDPAREGIDARALLTIRARSNAVTSLTLRLAQSLAVRSVASRQYGRLLAVRVRNQNTVVVNLPKSVPKDTVFSLAIAYRGRLAPQFIDREAVDVGQDPQDNPADDERPLALEPNYLYSPRSYWYPQAETSSYATATLRLRAPPGYACVASGDAESSLEATRKRGLAGQETIFRAVQPVRYLSVLMSRMTSLRADTLKVGATGPPTMADVGPAGAYYAEAELRTFATTRLRPNALPQADRAGDILRFYSSLVGDCPYPSLTLAFVERELPGGHSPGYLAVVTQSPVPQPRLDWRADPASFNDFPEFFLAHELAHQWWGQAVGTKNYHEQWLSEGLAQYFAALYAEHLRGRGVFDSIVRRLQGWALKASDEGPVYLGYRIGHVKREPRLYRAIVYNKSAAVLHQLRRLVGDEAFFRSLRRFYAEWRFRKAGSDDLRLAFEAETGRSLARFFERWIYGSAVPQLRFSWKLERAAADGADQAVVRFEQVGQVFDVPVTVTLDYADRPAVNVVVPVTEAVTEVRVPVEGRLRTIDANRDQAAIARISKGPPSLLRR